ncbi:Hypothetical protein PHPALM_16771 [Phytophthora palmivora]|uniref:HAT C-terminal dimerisation domain-containing protein n=1 Tax=Phytophthora palmivora TaxID=4796 RepID=A0A2P4XNX9_9STRA|nr:Hypothetical protein PHPALM_16771 [Phytophthora palmivora]
MDVAFNGLPLQRAVDGCVELASRVGLPSRVNQDVFRKAFMAFVRMKNAWNTDECEKNSEDTPLDCRFPLLESFAARVLRIPTSSAASERSWSVHSFIHNKRRNRLKPARVEKWPVCTPTLVTSLLLATCTTKITIKMKLVKSDATNPVKPIRYDGKVKNQFANANHENHFAGKTNTIFLV